MHNWRGVRFRKEGFENEAVQEGSEIECSLLISELAVLSTNVISNLIQFTIMKLGNQIATAKSVILTAATRSSHCLPNLPILVHRFPLLTFIISLFHAS